MPQNLDAVGKRVSIFDVRATPEFHRPTMSLDPNHVAMVLVDPQVDLSSTLETHRSAVPLNTSHCLVLLAEAAKSASIPLAISLTTPPDFPCEAIDTLKDYAKDQETIICWPRVNLNNVWVNDVGQRLRQLQITQIILAGMFSSVRIEAHLRDFIDQGFEVAVVMDAIAGAKIPEGIGYLSTLIRFRRIVDALWTTEETIKRLK